MKLSVSLPEEDVTFLDDYARARGFDSRSAVVHRALRLLRASELGRDYEAAWNEWFDADDAELWDQTAGDGIVND